MLIAVAYFMGAFLVTLGVTFAVLRRRLARGKMSFRQAAFASTVAANTFFFFAVFLAGRIYARGLDIFTRDAWQGGNSPGPLLNNAFLFVWFGTLICILPMLWIASYYEGRSRQISPAQSGSANGAPSSQPGATPQVSIPEHS